MGVNRRNLSYPYDDPASGTYHQYSDRLSNYGELERSPEEAENHEFREADRERIKPYTISQHNFEKLQKSPTYTCQPIGQGNNAA